MSDTPKSIFATIFSGIETNAVLHAEGGGTQSVHVRVHALPVRYLTLVLNLAEDESPLIELLTEIGTPIPDKPGQFTWAAVPSGWADNLTDDSHLELLEAAKKLNFSRAIAHGQRRVAAGRELAPIVTRWMNLASAVRGSGSPSA